MVSVLDLMTLCLDVVSVEDFAKSGLTPYVLTPFIHALLGSKKSATVLRTHEPGQHLTFPRRVSFWCRAFVWVRARGARLWETARLARAL